MIVSLLVPVVHTCLSDLATSSVQLRYLIVIMGSHLSVCVCVCVHAQCVCVCVRAVCVCVCVCVCVH